MFKAGQKVRIKHAPDGVNPSMYFHDWVADMTQYCGSVFTIKDIGLYHIGQNIFMVEGGPDSWVWYSDALELVDETPMHENNVKVISTLTVAELAAMYRDCINNYFNTETWASSFLPEDVTMEQAVAIKELCEACHNMGL